MRVENDFPKVDTVLRKLKEFVEFFDKKSQTETDEKEIKKCKFAKYLVEEYTSSIASYLDSVCNAEIRIAQATINSTDLKEVQNLIQEEDKRRTMYHSSVIQTMIQIDTFAQREGIDKVFDFAGEFEKDYNILMPETIEEKKRMPEAARIKRREMGNFGLYVAASITAGIEREDQYRINDDEARNFAACEGELQKTDNDTYMKVRVASKKVKRNMEDIIR